MTHPPVPMPIGWTRATGLLLALAGAATWSVGLTVAQPLSEPGKPWADNITTTNNMYWARDFRWAAVVVVLAALVLAAGGDRRSSTAYAGGAVGWLAVDTWLDRLDVAGSSAQFWTTLAACLVVIAAWAVTTGNRDEAGRPALIVAAALAAGVAPMAATITGPEEVDPAVLPRLSVTLSMLLIAVALACALAGGRPATRARLALTIGFAGAACLLLQQESLTARFFLGSVLLGAVVVLLDRAPRSQGVPLRRIGAFVAGAIAFPFLATLSFVAHLSFPVAPKVTALAGNPGVNSADWDTLLSFSGLLVGLSYSGLLLLLVPWLQRYADECAVERRARGIGDVSTAQ